MIKTIEKRQEKEKKSLIETLKRTPIIQIACEKNGVGRATYYRWRKEDLNFCKDADTALSEGTSFINDLAESQLISSLKDKNMTGIIFWLKTHHPAYTDKLHITGQFKHNHKLSDEQEKIMTKALNMIIKNKPKKIR